MKKDQEYQIRIHSPEHCEAVQNRLFQMGRKWASGDIIILNRESKWIFLWSGNQIGCSSSTSDSYGHPTITLDDLYAPPFTGPKSITVPLNDSYSAEVSKEGISVSVNGVKQTDLSYPLSVLDLLVEAKGRVGAGSHMDNRCQWKIHSPQHSRLIQERLFELGFKWNCDENVTAKYTNSPFLQINDYKGSVESNKRRITFSSKDYPNERYEPVTLDDLYGPKFTGVSEVKVDLGDVSYRDALVTKDSVKIGCQSFPISVLDALLAARKEVTE